MCIRDRSPESRTPPETNHPQTWKPALRENQAAKVSASAFQLEASSGSATNLQGSRSRSESKKSCKGSSQA
eukprot:2066163-Alexandrium_andersonii.AAC.1